MSELGGFESAAPDEGATAGSEKVSEQAKERFAAGQQQAKQQSRDEKKAKKRDDKVAETIRQFMSDEKYAHLYQLISRLVARDCPSIFILAVLSLIHKPSLEAVEDFIAEQKVVIKTPELHTMEKNDGLSTEARRDILLWTTRLELVMQTDTIKILGKLMVDEGNIDGSVLQLTTFVLVDYFEKIGSPVPYADLQPLTIKVLQDILEPHMETMEKHFQAQREAEKKEEEDE